jgi:hypothetical protein
MHVDLLQKKISYNTEVVVANTAIVVVQIVHKYTLITSCVSKDFTLTVV